MRWGIDAFASCRLLPAIVDDAGDLAAEVLAVDDHVHEAVLQHEFGGLEAVGQLDLDRLSDVCIGKVDPILESS
jgi:hypothetical protein